MTVRLTKDLRSQIAKEVMRDRFMEVEEHLWDAHANLARKIWSNTVGKMNFHLPTGERVAIQSIPKGWLPQDKKIKAKFGDEVVSVSFDGDFWSWGMQRTNYVNRDSIWMSFPETKKDSVVKIFEPETQEAKEYFQLSGRLKDYMEDIKRVKKEVNVILSSVTTMKQLLESWPEVQPYIENLDLPKPGASLPAVRVEELNKMLGLPKEAA